MRVQCCPGWVEVPRGSLLALLRKPLDVWSAQVQMCWPEMEWNPERGGVWTAGEEKGHSCPADFPRSCRCPVFLPDIHLPRPSFVVFHPTFALNVPLKSRELLLSPPPKSKPHFKKNSGTQFSFSCSCCVVSHFLFGAPVFNIYLDIYLIPGSRRSPGGGNGYPLQEFCLENPVDRGAWRAAVPGLQRVRQDGRMHASLFVLLGKVSLTDLPPSLWGSSVPRVLWILSLCVCVFVCLCASLWLSLSPCVCLCLRVSLRLSVLPPPFQP